MKIGDKFVKDGEIVEICDIHRKVKVKIHNLIAYEKYTCFDIVFFKDLNFAHCLRERDFLEQYKPYEPVYEYRWVQIRKDSMAYVSKDYYENSNLLCSREPEFKDEICNVIYKLAEQKRERVQ